MKLNSLWISSLLFASVNFSVQAEESSEPVSVQNDVRWVATAGYGITDISGGQSGATLPTFGGDVGYKFNKRFGVKYGGYGGEDFNFFGLIGDDYSFGVTYLALTARSESDFHVFGSLGYARVEEDLEIDSGTLTVKSTGAFWEVGAGWDFSKHIGVTFSYQQDPAEFADLSTLMLKIKVQF